MSSASSSENSADFIDSDSDAPLQTVALDDDPSKGNAATTEATPFEPMHQAQGDDDENVVRDNPDEALHQRKKSSIPFASFNVVNSIIGAGIFASPFALQEAGFFMGIILTCFSGALTHFSIRLMIRVGVENHCHSYQQMCGRAFNNLGFGFVTFCMWSFAFGAMVVYTTIIGEIMPIVFAHLVAPDSILASRVFVTILVSFCIYMPLSLFRNIAKLSKFSGVAMVAAFFCVFVIAFDTPLFDGSHMDGIDRSLSFANRNVFPALGIMAGAFVCHHNTFLIYASLKDATPRRWNGVAHMSLGVALVLLLFTSIAGYLAFGNTLKGNILRNLKDDVLSNIARLAAVLLLALTYPIECFVARECCEELLCMSDRIKKWLKTPSKQQQQLQQLQNENIESNSIPTKKFSFASISHDDWFHVLVTFAHVCGSVLLGLLAPNSGVVFELVGGFSAVCLAFILPALCALKLEPRKRLALDRIPTWFLLVFGVVAMFASTGTTLYNLISGDVSGN